MGKQDCGTRFLFNGLFDFVLGQGTLVMADQFAGRGIQKLVGIPSNPPKSPAVSSLPSTMG